MANLTLDHDALVTIRDDGSKVDGLIVHTEVTGTEKITAVHEIAAAQTDYLVSLAGITTAALIDLSFTTAATVTLNNIANTDIGNCKRLVLAGTVTAIYVTTGAASPTKLTVCAIG